MIICKTFKKQVYEITSKHYFFLLWSLLISLIAFVVSCWFFSNGFENKSLDTVLYFLTMLSGYLFSILFAIGITLLGWYIVSFRYLIYGFSWIFSVIRGMWKNAMFRIILVIILSAIGWGFRQTLYLGTKNYHFLKDILTLSTLLKILVISAAVLAIWQMYRYRKKLVISDFKNFTGNKELKSVIEGISIRILNEMNRISNLLNEIDEIHPDKISDSKIISTHSMDIHDLGKELGEIISPSSTLSIANIINIPLKPLYVFFRQKLRGPLIMGSIHSKGGELIMTASLKGSKYSGSWQIFVKDLEEQHVSDSQLIIQMTSQLVYRIFAYIFRDISPRWETMKYYTMGLKSYRETTRTNQQKKLNLIKAKHDFSMAIRKDNHFTQCYYNLGIVYIKLNNKDGAISAFRKAIELQPGYCHCYYQLAYIYFENKDFDDAQWFCEAALRINPSVPKYWNLLGAIHYFRWKNEEFSKLAADIQYLNNNIRKEKIENWFNLKKVIPTSAVYPFQTAVILSWRDLCLSLILGEKKNQNKDIAIKTIRNLAVIFGKMRKRSTNGLFTQALSLDCSKSEINFEEGKYFFFRGKWKAAHKEFTKVYEDDWEVGDSFAFWALYLSANKSILDIFRSKKNCSVNNMDETCDNCTYSEKCDVHIKIIKNGYGLFLTAAARLIHKGCGSDKASPQEIEQYLYELEMYINFAKETFTKYCSNQNFDASSLFAEIRKTIDKTTNVNRSGSNIAANPSNTSGIFDFEKWLEAHKNIKAEIKKIEDGKTQEVNTERLQQSIDNLTEHNEDDVRALAFHLHLANVYLENRDYERALISARKAVRYNPYDYEVRQVLGDIYIALKDYSKGIDELEISFNLGNPMPQILEKIGDAYYEHGTIQLTLDGRKDTFKKAIDVYNQCLDILMDKSYKDEEQLKENSDMHASYFKMICSIHKQLGIIYDALGEKDKAKYHSDIAKNSNNSEPSGFFDIIKTLVRCFKHGKRK